ncbi:hypothetical protein [Sphingobium aquiterrae]
MSAMVGMGSGPDMMDMKAMPEGHAAERRVTLNLVQGPFLPTF